MSCIDALGPLLDENSDPCFSREGVHYMFKRHANIIVLAVARSNVNTVAILYFLEQLLRAFGDFVKQVEEESVRDNFVVLYELLDEMMDFGHVQNTDINLLRDYVTQCSYKLEVSQALSALTDKVSWRPPGIFYKKNELFVDVIETVNALLDHDGSVLSNEIVGRLSFNVFLSGMPRLVLGINDAARSAYSQQIKTSRYRASRCVNLEDVAFHECVSLEDFERDRSITCIPPDGRFDLMTYRVRPTAKPLFKAQTTVETKSRSRVLVTCNLSTFYRKRHVASWAEVVIPLPADCDSPRFKASVGTVVYAPEKSAVIWRIKALAGGRAASMKAELLLPAVAETQAQPKAPVLVRFEIPQLACSGLEVRYLKVTEDTLKYQALPWVRYVTKSSNFEIRQAPIAG